MVLFRIYYNQPSLNNNSKTELQKRLVMTYLTNIRENRRGNNKWLIQRNWQHMVHKTNKNTTQYVLDITIRKQTDNVNTTRVPTLLQTTKIKTNQSSLLFWNRNGHYNAELRTQRHIIVECKTNKATQTPWL